MSGEILTQRRDAPAAKRSGCLSEANPKGRKGPRDAECAETGWKKVRLGDITSIKTGKLNSCAAVDDGCYPFFTCAENPLRINTAAYDSESVLVAGNCTPYVNYYNGKFNAYQRTYIITPTVEDLLGRWLYYWMRQQIKMMIHRQQGSVEKYFVLSDFTEEKLSLPPLPTQRKIAAVLSALDDKIENNRKICANLEAQAQAIFKSWFVDFEPFGGKMPQGWKMGKISSVFQLVRDSVKAGEMPDLPYLPIDMLPMHSFVVNSYLPNEEAQSSLILFKKWDVLIGAMRVYFHRVLPAPCDGITRTTCFVLRAIKDYYREFGLMAINQDEAITFAQQTSKGSTMPYAVWEGGLADYEIVIPEENTAVGFSRLVRNLIEEEQALANESRSLAAMRDALLPKLMSGEIDVEKVEVA